MTKPIVWTTRDGRRFRPRDMSNDHLVNAVKHCLRRAEQQRLRAAMGICMYLDSEPPDGAAAFANMELHELAEDSAYEEAMKQSPVFRAMVREMKRRGLEL